MACAGGCGRVGARLWGIAATGTRPGRDRDATGTWLSGIAATGTRPGSDQAANGTRPGRSQGVTGQCTPRRPSGLQLQRLGDICEQTLVQTGEF
eukprot:CAMPEP_0119370042 /NCGR_PEP_ID=MMETSP1334-20130426/16471_1 /TAXON_ID=127549 /ORGANISM="Calcidiscus leptoporus, Strain RCC1130" /LENGTH=93 /DNA_ID=CAMNT_0007387019 /DNA_START=168 /DNA_END=449 /DNA_ORIENTATION=-